MWKELIRMEVAHQGPLMPKPISVWARIDYQQKGEETEHSFQFATMHDGQLEPVRYFNLPLLGAMQRAMRLAITMSMYLKSIGAAANPEEAKKAYDAAEKKAEERAEAMLRERLDGIGAFFQPLDAVAPDEGAEVVQKKAETLEAPRLGTLGDRAKIRPLKRA